MSAYSDQIERLREPIRNIVHDYERWDGPFERQMLPEKQVIADIEDERDRALYLTLTVSVNYLRDAERLWHTTKDLWIDEQWIFEPAELVQKPEEVLSDLFDECGFRFPSKDAGIWYQNASALHRDFDSNPLNLFRAHDFDAEQILEYVGQSSDFSHLGGKKIGSLWMRIIHEDVHRLSGIENVDIPVDTHVRKVTNALLGVSHTDDDIREFWTRFCQETGMDPVKVDQPLWIIGTHWKSWGQSYLREQVGGLDVEVDNAAAAIPDQTELDVEVDTASATVPDQTDFETPDSDQTLLGREESYHQAMEKLVVEDGRRYAPNATTRPDYPTLTVLDEPAYSAANHEIYIESQGPGGGPNTLVFDLSEKRIKHAYGTYEDQQAAGEVKDIEFPRE